MARGCRLVALVDSDCCVHDVSFASVTGFNPGDDSPELGLKTKSKDPGGEDAREAATEI